MITLFDLGAEYWRNYFGSKSALDAYTLTYERIDWFWFATPGRLIVCADSARSIRRETHPTYKANRIPKPEDALDSLRGLQERISARGIPLAQVDGWEGDDVIATLTAQAFPEEVQIVGTEKDFYCLIEDGRVSLIGKSGRIEEKHCIEKFGVRPDQMVDWLALVGDAADAIEGCPQCGPGRATKLLAAYETLERVQMAAVSGALKGAVPGIGEKTIEALRTWSPSQALELVRMNAKLPIELWRLLA